ncbi:hypothetical protein Cni_G16581 [Canna indica]|uniref:Reverse transcriptase zinc-binding domain-containing protein n=1 Tax=Canna indica TaxID=4628 RepID=A0AAQ3KL52_9LILI|nr:hypothetical protein Cni_G16581 [Canna indica]
MDQIALLKPKDMIKFREKAANHIEIEELREVKKADKQNAKDATKDKKGKRPTTKLTILLKKIVSETAPPDAWWKKIWDLKVIPKVKIFLWKVLWGRLPTSAYLARISKVPLASCYVCGDDTDSLNHILFDCPFAKGYWEKIEMEFKIRFKHKENWFEGKWTEEVLLDKPDFSKWLIELIAASIWNLWKNRNNCYFNNRKVGYNTLFYRSIANIQWSVEPFTDSSYTNCNSLKPNVMLGKQSVNCDYKILCDAA